MNLIGVYAIPAIITICGLIIVLSKKDMTSEFLIGCKEGMLISYQILPTLIMLICATKMFTASGALNMICGLFAKATGIFGLPESIFPVIIMRPISGSGATAMINSLFEEHGPDSFAGRCASIIMGSSDTIIYTLSMYFSASQVKKSRHAFPASILILIFCVMVSTFLTRIFYY